MTIPITGQPPVPSLSEPDTFNTKALNLFTWQTGSMLDQFNNVDPNDFFDIPALTAAAAQSQNTNAIINGTFDIWQRGTTITGEGYGSDRWLLNSAGGVATHSRQAFPVGTNAGKNTPKYYMRVNSSGQSGSNYVHTIHKIEDVRSFAGETVTILGWAKRSSGSGDMSVEVYQQFGAGGSTSVATFAGKVPLTGSLEPFSAVVNVPSIVGKTIGSSGDHVQVGFFTSAGTGLDARTDSLGIQTIGVDLWGVHILSGTHDVEACDNYVAPRVVDELPRCQRYYQEVAASARGHAQAFGEWSVNTVNHSTMRATPSVVMDGSAGREVNDYAITTYQNRDNGLAFGVRAATAGDVSATGYVLKLDSEL